MSDRFDFMHERQIAHAHIAMAYKTSAVALDDERVAGLVRTLPPDDQRRNSATIEQALIEACSDAAAENDRDRLRLALLSARAWFDERRAP